MANDELFVTWTKQVLDAVKDTQKESLRCREDCIACREKVNKRLFDLDKRITVNGLKIAGVVFLLTTLLSVALKFMVP